MPDFIQCADSQYRSQVKCHVPEDFDPYEIDTCEMIECHTYMNEPEENI